MELEIGDGEEAFGLASHPSENHGELAIASYFGNGSPVRQVLRLKGQALS